MNSQILLTLEAARVNVKMTQEEAGKAIGVSANVISNCIRILSPHLRWGTRWSRSFA